MLVIEPDRTHAAAGRSAPSRPRHPQRTGRPASNAHIPARASARPGSGLDSTCAHSSSAGTSAGPAPQRRAHPGCAWRTTRGRGRCRRRCAVPPWYPRLPRSDGRQLPATTSKNALPPALRMKRVRNARSARRPAAHPAAQVPAEGGHHLAALRGAVVAEAALVACHPASRSEPAGATARRGLLGGARSRQPVRPPGVAQFDQHRQRPGRLACRSRLIQQANAGQAVRVHVAIETRDLRPARRPARRCPPGRSARWRAAPRNAERAVHLQLPGRRRGHPPRPGGELPGEQLRRHGGLAVRREPHPGRRAIGGHGADVVGPRAPAARAPAW